MTLTDRIFEECLRRAQLSGDVVELLKKDKNLLTPEERVRLQGELTPHYAVLRQAIAEEYAGGKREDVHNVHTWSATIIAESNERGCLTEFDEFVLGVLNDRAFDEGETERVRKRFMFADEWPVVSRGLGVLLVSLMIVRMWGYFGAILLSAIVMLGALVATFFYYSEKTAKLLGVLLGQGTQVIIGILAIGFEVFQYSDYTAAVVLGVAYAILFFAHGFAIPVLERLGQKWGKEPSPPFRGRAGE